MNEVAGTSEAKRTAPPKATTSARHTLNILATRVVSLPLTIVTSVLVARALGPTQRGIYEFLVLQGALSLPILLMGFNASATYFVASKRYTVNQILSTCLIVSVAQGCAGTLLLGTLWYFGILGETAHDTPATLLLPVLCILPLQSAVLSLTRLALGDSWFTLNNRAQLATALLTATMLLSFVVFMQWGVQGAVVGLVITNTTVFIGLIIAFLRRYRPQYTFDRSYVSEAWRYGLKAWTSDVAVQANARLDKWILGAVAAPQVLGLYGPVVTISETLWMVPDSLSFVLQNKIAGAADEQEQAALAERLNRVVFWTMAAAGIAIAAIAPGLVILLYGQAYAGSALPLRLLMPGTVVFCVSKVINKYFAGSGRPHFSGVTVLIGGATGVLLYPLLIPRLGITGAAVAHSTCYAMTALSGVVIYRRLVAPRVTRLFWPELSDLRWLREQFYNLIASRRRPSHAVTPADTRFPEKYDDASSGRCQ